MGTLLIVANFRIALGRVASLFALGLVLGSCAGLPSDGPSTKAVLNADSVRVERLTLATAAALRIDSDALPIDYPPAATPNRQRVNAGDLLTIALFESLPEGVFGTPATGGSVFDDVPVGDDGTIVLPYVGTMNAAGRDVAEIRREIIYRVSSFAIHPDAAVAVKSRNAGSVSVNGAVRTPGRVDFGSNVLTVQDALSRAGAPFENPAAAQVLIRRHSGSHRASLAEIMAGPPLLLEGDTEVMVTLVPVTFHAFGAVRRQGTIPITTADLNMLDALGAVGGLDGGRANPKGVFLFRGAVDGDVDQRPIVYQLDMRTPEALAIAHRFKIEPGDALYVTEAPVAQWAKVLSAVQGTISVGASAATIDRLVSR